MNYVCNITNCVNQNLDRQMREEYTHVTFQANRKALEAPYTQQMLDH
jgi:hypothetical protein